MVIVFNNISNLDLFFNLIHKHNDKFNVYEYVLNLILKNYISDIENIITNDFYKYINHIFI